jgi:eukaryotic-like serine/threonine-protein kinase
MSALPDETVRHLQRVLGEPPADEGRYAIGAILGQGGMGTVHLAHDRLLGRDVALKILRRDLADADATARLEREARILARLEHPGIVPVHDAGVLGDGRTFYVMKLVRGQRLEDAVRPLPLTDALRLFLRICETVAFAHAQGVVHRDLKPSNIMVGAFGEVLVLDWGIARLVGDETERRDPTATDAAATPDGPDTAPGTVLGTPGFMAPEQAHGWTHQVDARSDVWALGAILRTLADRTAAGGVARPLRSICSRACAVQPSDRYPSATALAADVTRFLDGDPVEAHRETPPERAGRVIRKYQTGIVLVLTYLVIRFLFLIARGV